ncbi:MAG: hypothetical protein GY858_02770 [Candidatus Omnitrophica bacterium]|nr:hypothetical protein [Candidatus Omnitrophota bacterium]
MNSDLRNKIVLEAERVAFFLFVVLVFFLPISSAIIEISFTAILVCFLVRTIFARFSLSKTKLFFQNKINLSLLIFYLSIAVSTVISPMPSKSFIAWFFKWGEGVLLFYFAQVFLTKKKVIFLLKLFLASSILICIDGFYQKIVGVDFIRRFSISSANNAIRATFYNPNNLSSYLTAMFFINYGVLYRSKKNWVKIIVVIASLMLMGGLLLTYSRAGWFSFLVGIILLVAFSADKQSRVLLAIFAAIFVAVTSHLPFFEQKLLLTFHAGGDAQRFVLWKAAILMFKHNPLFGRGLGLFMDCVKEYAVNLEGAYYAHNCYLQILAETGIFGLGTFLWFLWELLLKGYKELRRRVDFRYLGLFLGLISFLIGAFFDTQFYSLKLSIFFWLLLSFVAVYISDSTANKKFA